MMSTRRGHSPILAVWTLLAGGCGMAHSIDNAQLRELSIDQKLLLFHAQNEVAIALDEREQIRRDAQDLRRKLRRTEERIIDAEEDEDRAEARGNAEAAQVATLAAATYRLEEAWLEQRIEHAHARLDAQDGLIDVARAKLELAKATLVKRNNIHGAADIEVEAFERQVDEHVEAARAEREKLQEAGKEVETAAKAWQVKRAELEKASGGALGSPWVEQGSSWGGW